MGGGLVGKAAAPRVGERAEQVTAAMHSEAAPLRLSRVGALGAAELRAPDATALRGALGNRATVQLLAAERGGSRGATVGASVQAHAARGVHGAGAPLPHLGALQPLFGGHDLSRVTAHVDAAARAACAATGAAAYATGERVAFAAASPDLRTVAHEATHVVQQRAGVDLEGGVGAVGDAYEQQADRVADAATRGRSVAAMLPAAGDAGGPSAVQRLMSRDQMVARAGEPKADNLFGSNPRSKLYKALLVQLDGYTTWADMPVPALGSGLHALGRERVEAALRGVVTACDAFIARFAGLTGMAAYRASEEVARLAEVRSLRADAVKELTWLPLAHGKRDYVGMSWRDAMARAEVDRRAAPVRERIGELTSGRATIAEIRDEILQLDDMEVKQSLVRDRGLWALVNRTLDPSEAMILASVLLDRALVWWDGSGPDPTTGFQIKRGGDFSLWILEGEERGDHRPDLLTGTMNCWEGVLFSMYVAGVVSYATLRDMHARAAAAGARAQDEGVVELEQNPDRLREGIIQKRLEHQIVDTREQVEQWYAEKIRDDPKKQAAYKANIARTMGNDAYYGVLAESLGAHGAVQWRRGDDPPPAGNVVFFTGHGADKVGEKWRIAHVCISLGRRGRDGGAEIMNFGVASGGHTIWGCTTIEEGLDHKYHNGYIVMHGPSPLLAEV